MGAYDQVDTKFVAAKCLDAVAETIVHPMAFSAGVGKNPYNPVRSFELKQHCRTKFDSIHICSYSRLCPPVGSRPFN